MKVYCLAPFLLLAGCGQAGIDDSNGNSPKNGRYVGIGVFNVGAMWSQIKAAKADKDPPKATLADDEHIIVSVDTRTGEIRQCGDMSGYCTATNPWNNEMSSGQSLPTALIKHASDFTDEAAVDSTPTQKP
jgi:hypothetical protein